MFGGLDFGCLCFCACVWCRHLQASVSCSDSSYVSMYRLYRLYRCGMMCIESMMFSFSQFLRHLRQLLETSYLRRLVLHYTSLYFTILHYQTVGVLHSKGMIGMSQIETLLVPRSAKNLLWTIHNTTAVPARQTQGHQSLFGSPGNTYATSKSKMLSAIEGPGKDGFLLQNSAKRGNPFQKWPEKPQKKQ